MGNWAIDIKRWTVSRKVQRTKQENLTLQQVQEVASRLTYDPNLLSYLVRRMGPTNKGTN